MQIIEDAIERSKSHTEIVTIDSQDIRRAKVRAESVVRELRGECEGDVENTEQGTHEFWGTDLDGVEWRVRVEIGGAS